MGPGLDRNGGPRPVSIKGPSSLNELLLKPGTLYCIGPRGGGFARLSVARPTRTRDGRPALSLCSLSPCMYIYIYVYVFLPFFLLRWGSHRRSPNGSTRRSADGLPNEHPTDHQTEINRSRRRPPNRSPNGHQQITQTTTRRSPKRSPNIPPNGPLRSHTTDDNPAIQKTTQETTKRSPKRSSNRSIKRSPKISHKRSPNTSPTFWPQV